MTSRVVTSLALLATLTLGTAACGSSSETEPDPVALDETVAELDESTSYRFSSYTAQTLSSSLLGVDTRTEIDPDRPTVTGEVSPEQAHLDVDLGAALGGTTGAAPDLGFEMWVTEDRLTLDTRDYQQLVDLDPSVELGPFEPGISYVDLVAAGEADEDLLAALVGQGIPDLRQMAVELPELLDVTAPAGESVTGTSSYAEVAAVTGTDLEQVARGVASGLALNLGVDVDELTDLYVDFFEQTPADVTLETDDESRLQSLAYTTDLSGIFTEILERPEIFQRSPRAGELEQLEDLAADTQWSLSVLQRFEIDDELTVEPAPETDDDRTREWLGFLADAGF